MIFPTNAITKSVEVSGNGVTNIENSGNWTVLAFSTQQENTASLTQLRCGTTVINTNYAVDLSQVLMQYECTGTLNISKTGADKSFNVITYVPGFVRSATTTLGYNPPTSIASSTNVIVYGSLSAGEILIAFLLFSMILLQLTSFISRALDRVKTKKKFLAYNGGDVEIRNDL